MKKLLFILSLAMCFTMGKAQTSTISDYGPFIVFNFDTGDTISMAKNMMAIEHDGSIVKVVAPQDRLVDDHRAFMNLDPTDFGYAGASELFSYLNTLIFGAYYETYSHVAGSTNRDTVFYWHISTTDTTLQYIEAVSWDGDTAVSKTILTR